MINDQPVINYSYIKEDLSIPDIQFFSENLFIMTCGFKTSEIQNSSAIYDERCNQYIIDPSDKDFYYNGYFSIPLENNYKLVLPNNTKYGKRGEQVVNFQLRFIDVNVDLNTSSSFFVQISDSEDVDLKMNVSPIFSQSITQTNTYNILRGQSAYLYLSRSIRKFIIPNWKAIMGFQPDYIIKPYITSRMEEINSYINIIIICEVKCDDAIRPFGLLQNRGYFYERTQKKFTKFMSTYPLVHLLDSSNNIDDEDDESRVDDLEKKINDLELFLRDYVVEAQQLDNAYKNSESAKDK
ncbi:27543_t:CDS:2 [Gigaspora margarita]|uniref:27543_t:CDS:1 n=1 Tax=Gigaspora margarita TaxID=4874 RepID=A0ABN7UDR1_GIGMA|nr:27543_t:CDS:2 [Gigaspora margarita]